ncbi:MAG TPA: hypothetical protein VIJ34_05310 [Acidimicrobiales bacterium]
MAGVSGLVARKLAESTGVGLTQVIEILFALVLSSAIGLDPEVGPKITGGPVAPP